MNALDIGYAAAGVMTAPIWMRKQRGDWASRLARGLVALPSRGMPRVMLHAVSVGEVAALRTLVPLLTPTLDVVVTATTDTGLARARDLYGSVATVARYPLDFSRCVARFLDAVRPDLVALTELELWPNFLAACRRRGIPVCVINGRLSERSFRNYLRLRPVLRGMFAGLEAAAVQDNDYAARFIAMGTPRSRVSVCGSMKWDNAVVREAAPAFTAIADNLGIDPARPVIVAGSTGPGEEALLYQAWRSLDPSLGVQLVCAPRKPERFNEAAAALPGCVRRSLTRSSGPPQEPGGLFLLDSIGELSSMYGAASVVVVGRSFGDLHGSDPTEPIGLGKPTIIGPAVADFAAQVRALEAAGGLVRATRETLAGALASLLTDTDRAARVAAAGRACILAHQGASAAHAGLLAGVLARRAG